MRENADQNNSEYGHLLRSVLAISSDLNTTVLIPDRFPVSNDVTLDNVNFRRTSDRTLFFRKVLGHQEIVWILKQFAATAPC